MTPRQRNALARRIARVLFTNGAGQRAGRLVLEDPGRKLDRHNLGGWGEKPAADQIARVLARARVVKGDR